MSYDKNNSGVLFKNDDKRDGKKVRPQTLADQWECLVRNVLHWGEGNRFVDEDWSDLHAAVNIRKA